MSTPGPDLNPTPTTFGDCTRPALGLADFRRRAHARLTEKIDPVRSRHKPLSILRTEAKRAVEAVLNAESPTLSGEQRERLTEDVLAEAVGVGPLEELFRDDTVQEVMVVSPHRVLARRFGRWVPTTARFRDADQLRAVLARFGATGELLAGPEPHGGLDVRIANGFRVLAVVPPEIVDVSPTAVFVRGPAPGTPDFIPSASSGRVAAPAARSGPVGRSSVVRTPPARATLPEPAPAVEIAPPAVNPFTETRQRITSRIATAMATAGVYDLNRIALPDLRRIVLAHVIEFCEAEKMTFDDSGKERLALEILAGMNR